MKLDAKKKYVIVHATCGPIPGKGYYWRREEEMTELGYFETRAEAKKFAIDECTKLKEEMRRQGAMFGYNSAQSVNIGHHVEGYGYKLDVRHEFKTHEVEVLEVAGSE